MTCHQRIVNLAAYILFSTALNAVSFAQTLQFLTAPVVNSQIAVRWNAGTKVMQYALDDDKTFRAIGQKSLFLAKKGVFVTYPKLNPLVVQANASAAAVADPGFTAISKLIDAITGVATTVAPDALVATARTARTAPTGPCTDPATDIGRLVDLLYGSDTQPAARKKHFGDWVKAIDGAFEAKETGPEAINAAVSPIQDAATTNSTLVDNAKKQFAIVQNCKNTAGGAYASALLSDPSDRIQQLADTSTALTKLADLLKNQFADEAKWIGSGSTSYIISAEIDPTFEKMQNVTVKVVNIAFDLNSTSLDQSAAGSATFSVREYSSLTPEIGVGAVFGTVTAPVYGTAQNAAGQTIVEKKPNASVAINPTVLVNFVCRCGTGLLTPMAQIGAVVSKTTPGILMGGGIRLFGLSKGDVAIGGGAMFAWVKDLQTLKVGDVVTGTNAINTDLSFNGSPKVGGYFAIQYKF
jgi:hypothetical protein